MSERDDDERVLATLPPETRARLEGFARGLEHVSLDDLALYVGRTNDKEHRRAVETAQIIAIETGLDEAVGAARRVMSESVFREYAQSQFRATWFGMNTAPTMGPAEDRLEVVRSLGDAVGAIVLGSHLDDATQAELLGLWDRLLP